MSPHAPPAPPAPGDGRRFARRLGATILAVAAAIVLMFALWRVVHVLLVAFAGVLVGILLDGVTRFLCRHTTLTRPLAFGLVVALLTGLSVGFGLWVAPDIADQLTQLRRQIPEAIAAVRGWVRDQGWLSVVRDAELSEEMLTNGIGLEGLSGVFTTVFGLLGNILLALFIGVVTAARPGLYIDPLVRLLPHARRDDAREVIGSVGQAMRQWLIGRMVSMTIIAVGTSIGFLIIGLPLWLALGFLAGLLEFIPYVGPALAFVPAVLIGLLQDPTTGLHVALLFMAVQFAESYLITPFVEQYVVSIPAALLVTVQACMAILAGLVGVLLATPMTVLVVVLVQTLYIRRVLGDDVEIAGASGQPDEHPARDRPPDGTPEPA